MRPSDDKTLIVFGDSIAAGAWDNAAGGWVSRLWPKTTDTLIYNRSVDGLTSRELYWDEGELMERQIRDCGSDCIVILALGINDASRRGRDFQHARSRVSIVRFRTYMEGLITRIAKNSRGQIILGPTRVDENLSKPVNWDPELWFDNPAIEAYATALAGIVDKLNRNEKAWNAVYVPAPEVSVSPDGVHPDAAGHAKIAEVMGPYVERIPDIGRGVIPKKLEGPSPR